MPGSAREIRHQLGTYQNASAITGVLQLAIDTLDLANWKESFDAVSMTITPKRRS